MASLRSSDFVVVVVMAAAAAMAMMAVSGEISVCPDKSTPLVYPYWSTCLNPAVYYGKEVYELQASAGSERGSLAPEWDETNSTYYLRLADEGAKYSLTHITREYRSRVTQAQDVVLVNVETSRVVSWREEGDGDYFLVEEESGSTTFRISAADDVPLPCPLIFTARCQAYHLIDYANNSTGLSPSVEDGVTYFRLGSDKLPFVLLRSSSSTYTSIKSVLA